MVKEDILCGMWGIVLAHIFYANFLEGFLKPLTIEYMEVLVMRKNTAQKVEEVAQPIVDELGYELVDVEFVKEAGMHYLRVIIDDENGIGLDECEKVSRLLSPELDENNFIEENYFLEVCSPGIDRVLKRDKEFSKYSGKQVDVKLYKNDDELKTKQFEATLSGLDEEGNVVLIVNDKEKKLTRKEIAQIRLAVAF